MACFVKWLPTNFAKHVCSVERCHMRLMHPSLCLFPKGKRMISISHLSIFIFHRLCYTTCSNTLPSLQYMHHQSCFSMRVSFFNIFSPIFQHLNIFYHSFRLHQYLLLWLTSSNKNKQYIYVLTTCFISCSSS